MFNQILFLIIVLLTISFSPQSFDNPWIASSTIAFILGLTTYTLSLLCIVLQNKLFSRHLRKSRNLLLATANLVLIAFFILFFFGLTAQRVFPNSSLLISLFSLSLYFLGIYTFYYTAYPYIPAGSRGLVNSAAQYARNQVRFLFPFCLPFLFFSLVVDLVMLFPSSPVKDWVLMHHDSPIGTALILAFLVIFLIVILIFYPPLTVKIWKCRDLPPSEVKDELDKLCQRVQFKHAGMKTWTILNHAYTAAIVGVIPKFRFVMFTKRLLEDLSPRSIVAVLAHEIGHSARKHLLIFPVIIMGMVVFSGVFSTIFGPAFDEWFMMQDRLHPSPAWKALYPFALFLPYTAIFLLYFRLVFGYFSRLFERQADLHIYEVDLPPEDMQLALDELGHITGGTHQVPCWHHHSIQQRIDFIEKTKTDTHLISNHHRRVRNNLLGYLLLFGCGLIFLFIAPDDLGESVSDRLNISSHRMYSEQLMEEYQIPVDDPYIKDALFHSVRKWAIYTPQEIMLFAAADTLNNQEKYQQAATMMGLAWNHVGKLKDNKELIKEFTLLTEQIIRKSNGKEKQTLEKAYQHAISLP